MVAACCPASEDDRVILKCCGAVAFSNLSKVWTPPGGLALSHHLGRLVNVVCVCSPHHPQCVLHHSVGGCINSLGKWEVIREGLGWGDDLTAKAFLHGSDLMLF